jgi:hypothetical protein
MIGSLSTLGRGETIIRFRLARTVNSLDTLERLTVLDMLTTLSSRCSCMNERDSIGANSGHFCVSPRLSIVWSKGPMLLAS